MRWRAGWVVAGVGAVVGLLAVTNYVVAPMMIDKAISAAAPPPPAVAAEPAALRTLGRSLSGIGSVEAVQGVQVAAEVGGTVREIRFRSGSVVERGAVLVVLNSDVQSADIASARATLDNASRELDRARQLLADGWITRAVFDQRLAARDAARAAVERARADSDKRVVRAPFRGRVGIRQVDLGQFIDAGDPIVSLQSVDPIYVTAALPEQALRDVRVGQGVRVRVDTQPGRTFAGTVSALEAAVDAASRTVMVQATLPNRDGALTPGQSAELVVDLPGAVPVVTVPETAIAYALSGDTVFVLGRDKAGDGVFRTQRRAVTVGRSTDGRVEIVSGLKAGELVATNGQHKLREGGEAVIDNRLALAARPTPPQP